MDFNDASGALAESMPSFLRSYIFPSLLTLGIVVLFLAPAWPETVLLGAILKETKNEFTLTILFLFVALVIAVVSAFLVPPTYSLLVGYPKVLWSRLTKHQLKVFERLRGKSESDDPLVSRMAVDRLTGYPGSVSEIRPTRFGNLVSGAATYGLDRFDLDLRTFWYELKSVSTDGVVSDVKEAHQTVDFWVVVIVQSVLLALASLVTRCATHQIMPAVVGISSILLVRVAYVAAVYNLYEYRYAVQAMINLGRPGLAKEFGLQLPVSSSSEREMWQALSGLVQTSGSREAYDQVLNAYRIPPPKADPA